MTDDLIERLLPCPFCGGEAKHRGWRNRARDARAALQAAGGKQDGR